MDYNRFERLSGIELGMFVSEIIKTAELGDDILIYYQTHKDRLDVSHLEMMILLLERLGTHPALNVIADLLGHPVKSVRYQAAQVIVNAPGLDENAMTRVIAILSNPPYPTDIVKIDSALDRGNTDAARTLATSFKEGVRSRDKQ